MSLIATPEGTTDLHMDEAFGEEEYDDETPEASDMDRAESFQELLSSVSLVGDHAVGDSQLEEERRRRKDAEKEVKEMRERNRQLREQSRLPKLTAHRRLILEAVQSDECFVKGPKVPVKNRKMTVFEWIVRYMCKRKGALISDGEVMKVKWQEVSNEIIDMSLLNKHAPPLLVYDATKASDPRQVQKKLLPGRWGQMLGSVRLATDGSGSGSA